MPAQITAANMDVNQGKDYRYFPRCEYNPRFKRTSAFEMATTEYWGTYFRSTDTGGECDRIAAENGAKKTYTNVNTNLKKSGPSKTGAFKSPWENYEYRKIFKSPDQGQGTDLIPKNYSELYSKLIEYRLEICSQVVRDEEITTCKRIRVYSENDYPCILVHINDIVFRCKLGDKMPKRLYRISVALFTAITNYIARQEKIPVELVIRSSFGHNIPSVSDTMNSFRINIGLVPEVYATKVLVKSFKKLDEIIDDFFNSQLGKKDETTLKLLCRKKNRIASKKKHMDLLANYFMKEFQEKKKICNPVGTMKKILLSRSKEKNLEDCDPEDYHFPAMFEKDEHGEIKDDTVFWTIIEEIKNGIGENRRLLDYHLKKKKLLGLYSTLEKTNLEFIIHSGKCSEDIETGYGSDSDCEFELPIATDSRLLYYSKKITYSTGMRAINFAVFCAKFLTGDQCKINTDLMYYETEDAVSKVWDVIKTFRLPKVKTNQKIIKFIDLNHLDADGKCDESVLVNLEKIGIDSHDEVIVFDITSAKTSEIKKAFRRFAPHVPVVLLVSSGLKHEQTGADMNPYGTLRIISFDRSILGRLSDVLKAIMGDIEKLPIKLHEIRKKFKRIGAVVTARALFDEDDSYFELMERDAENTTESVAVNRTQLIKEMNEIVGFYLNSDSDRLHFLLCVAEQNNEEVYKWTEQKIAFLSSARVQNIVCDANETSDLKSKIRGRTFSQRKANTELFNRIRDSYDKIRNKNSRSLKKLLYEYQPVLMRICLLVKL